MAKTRKKPVSNDLAALKAALMPEEGPLAAFLAAIGDGVSVQDLDMRVLYANNILKQTFGEDIVGKSCHEIYERHPETCGGCPVQESYKSGKVSREVRTGFDKEGRQLTMEIVAAPIRNAAGDIVAGVEVARNISDQVKARLELEEKSRIQNELIKAAVSIASGLEIDRVMRQVARHAARLVKADAAMIALLDEERDMIIFPYAYNLPDELTQVNAPRDRSIAATVITTGKPLIVNDYQSFPAGRPEFARAGMKAVATVPLKLRDRCIGAIGVMDMGSGQQFTENDIDILKIISTQAAAAVENARLYEELSRSAQKLEQRVRERTEAISRMFEDSERKSRELEEANLKLREVDRLKSEFLANMSHELRTPLNSIIGFSKLMLDRLDGEINEEQERDLEIIHNNGQELLHLIDDLLNLAKIEAGRVALVLRETDIGELVRGVVMSLGSAASEKGLVLRYDIPEQLRPARVDPGKIRQILINLVGNAVKFTEKGTISVSIEQSPGATVFSVADTGIGIKPEQMEMVFDRFHQEKPGLAQAGGVGLGLTISRRFVEMHGGRIWVESTPGAGSVFSFRIPDRDMRVMAS